MQIINEAIEMWDWKINYEKCAIFLKFFDKFIGIINEAIEMWDLKINYENVQHFFNSSKIYRNNKRGYQNVGLENYNEKCETFLKIHRNN